MSWKTSRLSDLCSDVYSGGTPTSNNAAYYGGDIPWLRTQEVTFNRIRETELAITEAGYENSAAKWVPAKSVIVAMYGNSAGRSAVSEIPLTTNQACCNLVIDPERADYRYVFYALLLRYEELKGLAKGAAQNNLNASQVKGFEVSIHPRVEEQQRIADTLSAYDDLIENNRRRIALLEQSARLLYREWFVHLRFPGHEQVKVVDGVPEGWERKPLKEIATLNYGKALKEELRQPGPYPVYGSSGIVGSHMAGLTSGPGIIVGRKGNVGSVYWSPVAFFAIDTVYYISVEQSSLYLYYALQDAQFISTDVAVPGLNREFAYSRQLLVPADDVLSEFLEAVMPFHQQIEKLTVLSEKLRQARDLLLPRLMSGDLAV